MKVSRWPLRLVSHGAITSGSPPERFEICVSRTYFPRESQQQFQTDRIRPSITRIHVSALDWEGSGCPSVGARCPAVTHLLRQDQLLDELASAVVCHLVRHLSGLVQRFVVRRVLEIEAAPQTEIFQQVSGQAVRPGCARCTKYLLLVVYDPCM